MKIQFEQLFKVLVIGLNNESKLISEYDAEENKCIQITELEYYIKNFASNLL